jgi:hypothetical protein
MLPRHPAGPSLARPAHVVVSVRRGQAGEKRTKRVAACAASNFGRRGGVLRRSHWFLRLRWCEHFLIV